jgi:hypothetical protein
MQTTKLLFVLGLGATLVAFALTSGAGDTAAQIKAREALRQKMSELDTPSATAAPPTAPAKPATPPPPAAPPQAVAPAVAPPKKAPVAPAAPAPVAAPAVTAPNAAKFAPVPAAVEADNAARAREALRQQMASLQFGPVPDAIENANTARARAALRQEMAALEGGADGTFGPAPSAVANANARQLQAALQQEIARQQRTPAATTKYAKTTRPSGVSAPLLQPPPSMEVALSPLTGPKAARLAELLTRYEADQITPKEYHIQRAAIVAEP